MTASKWLKTQLVGLRGVICKNVDLILAPWREIKVEKKNKVEGPRENAWKKLKAAADETC